MPVKDGLVMQQERQYEEDEIDLVDLFRVLWKRKKIIIIGSLMMTFAAAGVSSLLPKVYEVTAMLEPGMRPIANDMGQIVGEKPVVTPESIKEVVLGGAYDAKIQKKLNIPVREFPEFKISIPKRTSLVKFSIESSEPQQAVAILNELIAQITKGIQKRLGAGIKINENNIALARINRGVLAGKLKLVEKQIAEITYKIQDIDKEWQKVKTLGPVDVTSLLIYSNGLQDKQVYLNGLHENKLSLEAGAQVLEVEIENFNLSLASYRNIEVNKKASVSKAPIRPKKVIVVGFVFFASLIGMTMLAFLLEFLQRVKGSEEMAAES